MKGAKNIWLAACGWHPHIAAENIGGYRQRQRHGGSQLASGSQPGVAAWQLAGEGNSENAEGGVKAAKKASAAAILAQWRIVMAGGVMA
jgi:hypothetical protein